MLSIFIFQLFINLSVNQDTTDVRIDFEPGVFTISGKIDNPTDRTINIISQEIFGRVNQYAKVNEKGEFHIEVGILSPHDNMLRYDNQLVTFFAGKGDSIYLTANSDEFRNSARFFGDRKEINSTMLSFGRTYRSLYDSLELFSFKVGNNDVDLFLERIKIFEDRLKNSIAKSDINEDELKWFESKIKYEIADELVEFKRMQKGEGMNSKYYLTLSKYLSSEISDLKCSDYTEGFLNEYYERQLFRESSYGTHLSAGDPYSAIDDYMKTTDRLFTDTLSKDLLYTKICQSFIDKGYDEVISYIFKDLSGKIYNDEFTTYIGSLLENKKSQQLNENLLLNDLISLDEVGELFSSISTNHPDKILYIDLWGVWCKPCLGEFSHSKSLYRDLKDQELPIEFIYLACVSGEQKWKETITKYDLSGMHHLLNNDQYNILSDKINLTGFPHYLIVDKDENVINNAKRPSDKTLKQDLIDLTKM